MFKRVSVAFLTIFLSSIAHAEVLYTSDQIRTDLRSGPTNQHRIVKFLKSGAELEVFETSEDGAYRRVQTSDGKEGWVSVPNLMAEPAARNLVPALNDRISTLKADIRDRDASIKELKKSLKDAESKQKKLDQFGQQKSRELDELKRISARPALLAKQNSELTMELERANTQIETLSAQNAELEDGSIREWFMIGAGVALLSLLIGLVIPSINWRKKDSWGGGF